MKRRQNWSVVENGGKGKQGRKSRKQTLIYTTKKKALKVLLTFPSV